MNHELIDLLLEQFQWPAAAADLLRLLRRQHGLPQAVAVGGIDVFDFLSGRGVRGFIERRESALRAIGVIAAGIGPEHDGRAGVKELATDHDLIATALEPLANFCLLLRL